VFQSAHNAMHAVMDQLVRYVLPDILEPRVLYVIVVTILHLQVLLLVRTAM
jgi:hypothetical protein